MVGIQLLTFLFKATGTVGEIFRNSSSLGTDTYDVQNLGGTLIIASNPDSDSNEADHQQVLIYEEAQSAGNRGSVESYLMGRLGI